MSQEAGSPPTGPLRVFFSHVARSRNDAPYMAHVPHPTMWWVFAVVSTEVVGAPPSGLDDAEQITQVLHLPVSEAIGWLADSTADDTSAEVLRLARHLDLI